MKNKIKKLRKQLAILSTSILVSGALATGIALLSANASENKSFNINNYLASVQLPIQQSFNPTINLNPLSPMNQVSKNSDATLVQQMCANKNTNYGTTTINLNVNPITENYPGSLANSGAYYNYLTSYSKSLISQIEASIKQKNFQDNFLEGTNGTQLFAQSSNFFNLNLSVNTSSNYGKYPLYNSSNNNINVGYLVAFNNANLSGNKSVGAFLPSYNTGSSLVNNYNGQGPGSDKATESQPASSPVCFKFSLNSLNPYNNEDAISLLSNLKGTLSVPNISGYTSQGNQYNHGATQAPTSEPNFTPSFTDITSSNAIYGFMCAAGYFGSNYNVPVNLNRQLLYFPNIKAEQTYHGLDYGNAVYGFGASPSNLNMTWNANPTVTLPYNMQQIQNNIASSLGKTFTASKYLSLNEIQNQMIQVQQNIINNYLPSYLQGIDGQSSPIKINFQLSNLNTNPVTNQQSCNVKGTFNWTTLSGQNESFNVTSVILEPLGTNMSALQQAFVNYMQNNINGNPNGITLYSNSSDVFNANQFNAYVGNEYNNVKKPPYPSYVQSNANYGNNLIFVKSNNNSENINYQNSNLINYYQGYGAWTENNQGYQWSDENNPVTQQPNRMMTNAQILKNYVTSLLNSFLANYGSVFGANQVTGKNVYNSPTGTGAKMQFENNNGAPSIKVIFSFNPMNLPDVIGNKQGYYNGATTWTVDIPVNVELTSYAQIASQNVNISFTCEPIVQLGKNENGENGIIEEQVAPYEITFKPGTPPYNEFHSNSAAFRQSLLSYSPVTLTFNASEKENQTIEVNGLDLPLINNVTSIMLDAPLNANSNTIGLNAPIYNGFKVYKVQVFEYGELIYQRTIFIGATTPAFNINYYAGNPSQNPYQKSLITKTLPNGQPNPSYNPSINAQTGTVNQLLGVEQPATRWTQNSEGQGFNDPVPMGGNTYNTKGGQSYSTNFNGFLADGIVVNKGVSYSFNPLSTIVNREGCSYNGYLNYDVNASNAQTYYIKNAKGKSQIVGYPEQIEPSSVYNQQYFSYSGLYQYTANQIMPYTSQEGNEQTGYQVNGVYYVYVNRGGNGINTSLFTNVLQKISTRNGQNPISMNVVPFGTTQQGKMLEKFMIQQGGFQQAQIQNLQYPIVLQGGNLMQQFKVSGSEKVNNLGNTSNPIPAGSGPNVSEPFQTIPNQYGPGINGPYYNGSNGNGSQNGNPNNHDSTIGSNNKPVVINPQTNEPYKNQGKNANENPNKVYPNGSPVKNETNNQNRTNKKPISTNNNPEGSGTNEDPFVLNNQTDYFNSNSVDGIKEEIEKFIQTYTNNFANYAYSQGNSELVSNPNGWYSTSSVSEQDIETMIANYNKNENGILQIQISPISKYQGIFKNGSIGIITLIDDPKLLNLNSDNIILKINNTSNNLSDIQTSVIDALKNQTNINLGDVKINGIDSALENLILNNKSEVMSYPLYLSAISGNNLYYGQTPAIEVVNNKNFNFSDVINLGELNIPNIVIPLNEYNKTYNTYYTLEGAEEVINGYIMQQVLDSFKEYFEANESLQNLETYFVFNGNENIGNTKSQNLVIPSTYGKQGYIPNYEKILKDLAIEATRSHQFSVNEMVDISTLASATYSTGSDMFLATTSSNEMSSVNRLSPKGIIPMNSPDGSPGTPGIYNPNNPAGRNLSPSQKFMKQNNSGIITLITCAVVAGVFGSGAYYVRKSGRYAYNQK